MTWRRLIHPNNLTMRILGGDDIGVGADFEAAAVNEARLPHAFETDAVWYDFWVSNNLGERT